MAWRCCTAARAWAIWPLISLCSKLDTSARSCVGSTVSPMRTCHCWMRALAPGPRFYVASSGMTISARSEEHTSELQSRGHLVCRLLLETQQPREERSRLAVASQSVVAREHNHHESVKQNGASYLGLTHSLHPYPINRLVQQSPH